MFEREAWEIGARRRRATWPRQIASPSCRGTERHGDSISRLLSGGFVIVAALSGVASAFAADPHDERLPKLRGNDAWAFRQTVWSGNEVVRVSTPHFLVDYISNSGLAPIMVTKERVEAAPGVIQLRTASYAVREATCLLDVMDGGPLRKTGTCPYPLRAGMRWEQDEGGANGLSRVAFDVVGPETVTLPAGQWPAVKIVAVSRTVPADDAESATESPRPNRRMTFWYAAAAKVVVRSDIEFLDPSGAVVQRFLNELVEARVR